MQQEPSNNSARAFIDGSVEGMKLLQDFNVNTWHLNSSDSSWSIDTEAGKIIFTFPDKTVKADVQIVGTLYNGEFLWGWDHPSVPQPLSQAANLARQWGEEHNQADFINRTVAADINRAWEFTAVAARLNKASGTYSGMTGEAHVFMTFGALVLQGTTHSATEKIQDTEPSSATTETANIQRSIDLNVKQSWLEKSSETALEEFKSVLASTLNNFYEDRHVETDRWEITKISEGGVAHLVYDERSIATLKIEPNGLNIVSQPNGLARYDDLMSAIRYAADRLLLAVYSNLHGGARLPQDYRLALDQTYFDRDKAMAQFFAQSKFMLRYTVEGMQYVDESRQALVVRPPYYAENKDDGTIHIINSPMLTFLSEKDDQDVNREFSYRVAGSMQDFARKYDLGLVPSNFYQNYGLSSKIINDTYFDVFHITRKVFIDPYVWDFDDEHDYRFYKNVKNGMHLMDKVRKGENLDQSLKRVLREELQVSDNYVGAKVWGIEFDRDRDGILTPRLKINIFVHGMAAKRKSRSHDWVSVK